ncbi:hypothetical protein IT084_01795 [Desulfallas sp. Bu1-1]|uniref:hypothetical protein n=1 Tax=Desulfallas sp. Bu1-1 TaxID=2787620 RepID=UPI00189FB72A|nr:hypothetical protein [Desulfallas sp. Bu1-1]MBF7081714.1 hypothetical protein [Desulfallas sp. Bu1-1]
MMKPRVRLSKHSAPDRAGRIHVKVREIQVQKVPAGPGPAEREHARARETPAENVPAKLGPAEDMLVPGQTAGPGGGRADRPGAGVAEGEDRPLTLALGYFILAAAGVYVAISVIKSLLF